VKVGAVSVLGYSWLQLMATTAEYQAFITKLAAATKDQQECFEFHFTGLRRDGTTMALQTTNLLVYDTVPNPKSSTAQAPSASITSMNSGFSSSDEELHY